MKAVYAIRNGVNLKAYVGSTTNYEDRKAGHFKKLRRGMHESKELQEDFNLYGENAFSVFILEELKDDSDFLKKEDEYVLKLNTLIPDGYNAVLPSSKNDCPKEKSIRAQAHYINNAPPTLKKISPEEWIENKKENPNFKITQEPLHNKEFYRKEVYRIDPVSSEILETLPSIALTAEKFKIKVEALSTVLRRNKQGIYRFYSIKGNVFVKKENYILPLIVSKPEKIKKKRSYKKKSEDIIPYSKRDLGRKEITLINNVTGEIKSFSSISEAAEKIASTHVKINELIKGIRNKGGGSFCKVSQIKGWSIHPA